MRAIIPVAGEGTRLRPHTHTLPKVLLNVAGKPILAHILDALDKHGVKKTTIITGHLGDLVEDYVVNHYQNIEFSFIEQKRREGLGHSIWIGKETIDNEPLLIILGDTIFDVDLQGIINSEHNIIGVKWVEDPRRFGVVELDSQGFVRKFVEKPKNPTSNLAIVGIYMIKNPLLLIECLDELIAKDMRTKGEYQLTDALQLMLEKGEKFKTFSLEGWYDCGKPETLLSTNRYLLGKETKVYNNDTAVIIPPVYISPTAKVERSVIGPYASVGDNAKVLDSVIRDSIIGDKAEVFSSLLESSIVGNNALVTGHFSKLSVGNDSEINFK